ncbi:hypothetical protein [Ensifer sp. 4252]|uniref:hypothetical protein n=1 Tax=Ensifer sp. 4252 TaxID=3373915 RepID=UPI003D1EDFBC
MVAKGMTNGAVPMGGVIVNAAVYEPIAAKAQAGAVELSHLIRAIRWQRRRGSPRCMSMFPRVCLKRRQGWSRTGRHVRIA